jgi:chlorite dismutase
VEYTEPDFDPPYRVLVLVASTDGWYGATMDEREAATDELGAILRESEDAGARLIASFDDDLFLTGQPAPLPYTIFVLYDVDDLSVVVRLVHRLRTSHAAKYLRLEARVGRPLFVIGR